MPARYTETLADVMECVPTPIRHQMAWMMLAQGACQVKPTSERIRVRQNRTRARWP